MKRLLMPLLLALGTFVASVAVVAELSALTPQPECNTCWMVR
jgi:hypothetical protein